MIDACMVRRLVAKDWYFQRFTLALYLALGGIGLAVFAQGTEATFYVGSVSLVFVLLAMAVHLTMATIVEEHRQQTLFLASLPVSARELAAAKLFASLSLFLVPWALLGGGVLLTIASDRLPGGLAPYVTIHLLLILLSFCGYVATAMVTRSMGCTVAAIVACNLGFNFSLFFVARLPGIEPSMEGAEAVWNGTVGSLLAAEAVAILLVLCGAFFFSSRRKDLIS